MGRKLIITAGLALLLAIFYFSRPPPVGKVVQTKVGKLEGIISKSRDGRDFYEWLGVPYAQPPVGNLRYASPKPVGEWEGIRVANKYGARCAQLQILTNNLLGQEDCLFLNIHVPKVGNNDELPTGLPVMLYIHGGGFNLMSSDDYRPDYFMDEDVIVVIINYRLGTFGFLSTADGSIRGNMGLKDQAMALKWVHENIEHFGGDPNRITIFGESAGGASVHFLMISPTTRGLFSRAISQSGVASNPWAIDPPEVSYKLTQDFAALVDCNFTEGAQVAECLRSVSVSDLLYAAIPTMKDNDISKPHLKGHFFRPTIELIADDQSFLTQHPFAIVAKGEASRVPWMVGVNADEGLMSSLEFYRNEDSMASYEANWEEGIARTFGISPDHKRLGEIASKIEKFYFPANISHDDKLLQYTKLFSDAHFNFNLNRMASAQRNFSDVYLYRYNRRGAPSLANLLVEIKERFNLYVEIALIVSRLYMNYYLFGEKPKDYGVCHGDELGMLFLLPGLWSVAKNDEHPDFSRLYKASKELVRFWADFAKGEEDVGLLGVNLTALSRNGPLEYFDIRDKPVIVQDPFEDRMSFLKSLDFDTC